MSDAQLPMIVMRRPPPPESPGRHACRGPGPLRLRRLIAEIAAGHGLTYDSLVYGRRHLARHVAARREAVITLLTVSALSSVQVGVMLNLDHTTVLHHLKRMTGLKLSTFRALKAGRTDWS